MAVKRLDHTSVVVEDLASAVAFFAALGLSEAGSAHVHGEWVDRVNALHGVDVDIVMMIATDGHGRIELTRFRRPELVAVEPRAAPPYALGPRGPAGVIVALAEGLQVKV